MKRVGFLFLLIFIMQLLLGDVAENFDGWTDGSYGTISSYVNGGVGHWESSNARTLTTYARSGKCIQFNDDSPTTDEYLLYKGLDGNGKDNGIGIINFWYKHYNTNVTQTIEFKLEYQLETTEGTWTQLGSNIVVPSDYNYHEYYRSFNIPGDNIYIRIINVQDLERLHIDDLLITDFTSGIKPLVASFGVDKSFGLSPFTVNFFDSSHGGVTPYTYQWDFDNNGSIDNTDMNPSHVYTTDGNYSVKIIVTDATGSTSSTIIKEDYITVSSYYSSVTSSSSEEMRTQIHNTINNHISYQYSDATIVEALNASDATPGQPGRVTEVYSGMQDISFADKECVWNEYHGNFKNDYPAYSDLHNLKPEETNVTSIRARLDFDEGGSDVSTAPGNFVDLDSFEPRDEVKGDIARILFYMDVRYEGDVPSNYAGELDLVLVDDVNTDPNESLGHGEYGKLSTLLKWHLEDPVDDFERNRNNVIYSYQNNRNPFIDNPEWVLSVFLPITPIADIQQVDDPLVSDVSPLNGSFLRIAGFVSAVTSNGYYLQDYSSGPWSGIYIDDNVNTPAEGDELELIGRVAEDATVTIFTEIAEYNLISSGNIIAPVIVETNDLDETYESTLVQVINVTVTQEPNANNIWKIDDGSGECEVGYLLSVPNPIPQIDEFYAGIIGIVDGEDAGYVLSPRSDDDFIFTVNNPPVAMTNGPYVAEDDDGDGWAEVTMDGSASYDEDGEIAIYEWSWVADVNYGAITELFISEYFEGSNYRKAIEIYNGTPYNVDMTGYLLERDESGTGNFSYSITLEGEVAPYSTYVVVYDRNNNTADLAGLSDWDMITSDTMMYYSGNDQIRLVKIDSNETIDFIGENGNINWGRNKTFVRKPEVYQGSIYYHPEEWQEMTYDDISTLGSHSVGAKIQRTYNYSEVGEVVTAHFPLGITTVYLTVTDNLGLTAVDSTIVTINESIDTNPPRISNIVQTPELPQHYASVEITVSITDDNTLTSTILRWGYSSAYMPNSTNLVRYDGDNFSGEIPGYKAGTYIYYQIEAIDDTDEVSTSAILHYQVQYFGSGNIVFTEVCEPTTTNASFIELYNAGTAPVSLLGWEVRQYNSSLSTLLDLDLNTDLLTNMDDEMLLLPGSYVIIIKGSLAEFTGYYGAYNGYYFTDGSSTQGVPNIDGNEYYELYDNSGSKALVDNIGSATSTILNAHRYERVDALDAGTDISTNWIDVTSTSIGTPGAKNLNTLNSDYSVLPVTFSNMYLSLTEQNAIEIHWATASESNLNGFKIYRLVMDIDSEDEPLLENAESFNSIISANNNSDGADYSFLDQEVYRGYKYYYWIECIGFNGHSSYYGPVLMTIDNNNQGNPSIPLVTKLKNIYPNPFNPETRVSYSISTGVDVKISVYNLKGQCLKTLVDRFVTPGNYYATWNGKDSNGKSCPSGVYFFRMDAGKMSSVKKALLLK
ncbi:MAG: endonuclease [Candidatus Cloacimonetes bacterium]|nr:endonuclease [Candidatus Cloacimonadota bacterium]